MQEPQFSKYKLHEVQWVIFAHDSTWINTQRLLPFLARVNPAVPLSFGYYWDEVFSFTAHMSGGGGMVFSASAAKQVGSNLFTPACPDELFSGGTWADVMLSHCASQSKVLGVSSSLFHVHGGEQYTYDHNNFDPGSVKEAFSFASVESKEMAQLDEIVRENLRGKVPKINHGGLPGSHAS